MTQNILDQVQALQLPDKVIVAVSGGVDSVVLLDALIKTQPQVEFIVAHVNYHLRPQSDNDAHFVAEIAKKYHVVLRKVDWQGIDQGSVEEAARNFRYCFFEELANEYATNTILVAHHANDQAETILLKLVRGGKLSQLSGMQPTRQVSQTVQIVRPLLPFSKQLIKLYAQQHRLEWCEDSTNADSAYTPRNLIRLEILPRLTTINHKAIEHINQTASQIMQQEQMITMQATQYLDDIMQSKKSWGDIPEIWLSAVLSIWLQKQKIFNIKQVQIDNVKQLIQNTHKTYGMIQINHQYQVVKSYQNLTLESRLQNSKSSLDFPEFMLKLNQWQINGHMQFQWTNQKPLSGRFIAVHSDHDIDQVTMRRAKTSDKIAIKSGHKTMKRLFIDNKVAHDERHQSLIIEGNGQILAVRLRDDHWRISDDFIAKQDSQPNYWLLWRIEE